MRPRFIIVTFALVSAMCAQTKPSAKAPPTTDQIEAQKAAAAWRERAERLTSACEEDSWHIGIWRAAMNARLADIWRKDDPVRAKQWLIEAYDEVSFQPQNESEADRSERLQAGSIVYEALNRIDPARADKLQQALLSANKKTTDPDVRQANSMFLQLGMQNAMLHASEDGDVDRAKALAEQALQIPNNQMLLSIVSLLKWQDPAFADAYYLRALKAAVASSDYENLDGLMQLAFPYFDNHLLVSEGMRSQVAEILGQFLSRVPKSPEDMQKYCERVPEFASHLVGQLPPAQQGVIQGAIASCKAMSPEGTPEVPGWDACVTSDACLKLAAEADSPEMRARWKDVAAIRAIGTEHAPIRALEILDSFTDDEKKFSPQWAENYERYSRDAFDELYAAHDTTSIQRIIDHAPAKLRAEIVMNFVDTLKAGKNPDLAYARTMLTEVRRILESAPSQHSYIYLALVQAYMRLLPDEVSQAFAFAISGLNQVRCPDTDENAGKSVINRCGLLWDDLQPIPLKPLLLERDEAFTIAAIKTLDDPKARIAFRLGLTQTALKEYERELKKKSDPVPKTSPAETPTAP